MSPFAHLRLLGPLTAAAALSLGTLPALAQTVPTPATGNCSAIHFELANPSPGSRVEPGGFVLEGIAQDTRAQSGTGIDRIEFFLDSRDQGGETIGTAAPGMVAGPLGPDSFQTTLSLPDMVGGHDLFAYAHSVVTDQESIISVPISVGQDPDKLAMPLSTSITTSCTAAQPISPGTTTTTTVAPVSPPTTITPPLIATINTTVAFQVANPSPGDTIHTGGYMLEGTGLDRSAQAGPGIDKIDIFLDNRDEGGLIIGGATFGTGDLWHGMVTLPSNETGLHTLYFYVRSAVTGGESVFTVPVTVAP